MEDDRIMNKVTTGVEPDTSIRYDHLTAEEYATGVQFCTDNLLAVDYGERPLTGRNPWGRYVMLMAENRSPEEVDDFEAAIGWVAP